MKVNHAGEQGAVCIYRGQRWVARVLMPELVAELAGYQAHEERHRAVFARELARRGKPRCRSYWFCAVGGLFLGMITALMGRRAIAATTVAVERVVLRHLDEQRAALRDIDPAAATAVDDIAEDELEHHDSSARALGRPSAVLRMLMAVVSASTEFVIWLGMKL